MRDTICLLATAKMLHEDEDALDLLESRAPLARSLLDITFALLASLFFFNLRSSKQAMNKAIAGSSTLNPKLFGKEDLAVLQHSSKLGRHLHWQGGGCYQQVLPFPLCDQGKVKGKSKGKPHFCPALVDKTPERHFHVTRAMCERVWHDLDDTYLLAVVHDGLLFDRTAGMDPITPDPLFSHIHLRICIRTRRFVLK